MPEKKNNTGKKKLPLFTKRSEWVREKKITAGKKKYPLASKRSEWVALLSFPGKKKYETFVQGVLEKNPVKLYPLKKSKKNT